MNEMGSGIKLLPSIADYPRERLFSLDLLRGLDMVLLTVVGPLVCAAQRSWNCFPEGFMRQFGHGWDCFTLWDIIMPLFIFMCGAAMPFAMGRRLAGGKDVFWRHVLLRVAWLWFLGGLVQGNWMDMNSRTFSPFSNTLQSIAVGYLATAAVMTVPSEKFRMLAPVALAGLYTLLLVIGGDYSRFGNFAQKVDHAILSLLLPSDNRYVANPSHYTWFLTSLMFASMTMCGFHAAQVLRAGWTEKRKAMVLFACSAGLLLLGRVSAFWIPVIKPIFTLSFTSLAMGWCVFALAFLYVVCDIWKIRRGLSIVLLFGQCALTAYFTSQFLRPVLNAFAHLMGDGLAAHLPKSAAGLVVCALSIVGMILIMLCRRKLRTLR